MELLAGYDKTSVERAPLTHPDIASLVDPLWQVGKEGFFVGRVNVPDFKIVLYIYTMYNDLSLINNEAIHNFELFVDGHRAFIDYKQHGDKVFLIHTEVPVELEGKGVAPALVEKTFKYLEEHHLKMVPYCEYIKVFLKRHPEWQRLVA